MDNNATERFRRDFIIKTLVQQSQFEQWLKMIFYLNQKLTEEYDTIYQDAFYVKIYELLTTGLDYAEGVFKSLQNGNNKQKKDWYNILINGLNEVKAGFDGAELDYIEYRRHCASHIFQNQYEHIQEDFKIKKERKSRNLAELNAQMKKLILTHGSDRNVDDHLNRKICPKLTEIYQQLTKQPKQQLDRQTRKCNNNISQ